MFKSKSFVRKQDKLVGKEVRYLSNNGVKPGRVDGFQTIDNKRFYQVRDLKNMRLFLITIDKIFLKQA